MAITQSLFPAILGAKKHSEKLYYERLQRLYDLMVWLAVAVALPTTFLSGWVVNLLYGPEYAQAGGVLALHIWAGLFVAMGVASGRWLLTENLQIISAKNTALGAVINVVLNFLLLPYIGILGAAFATVISYGFAAYVSLAFYSKTRINFYYLSRSLNLIRRLRLGAS
jgi:O-antigen/teichoic acid export membrane protein